MNTSPRRQRTIVGLTIAIALTLGTVGLATSAGRVDNGEGVRDAQGQRDRSEQSEHGARRPVGSSTPASTTPARPAEAAALEPAAQQRGADAQAQLDAAARARLRQQILSRTSKDTASTPTPPGPDPDAAPDQLSDRTDGAHPELLAALNTDFLPLANECITTAKDDDPAVHGMVTMELEVVADEDLGAVIQTIAFPTVDTPTNAEAELHTCLRETALSMLLPPGHQGHAALVLTLNTDD